MGRRNTRNALIAAASLAVLAGAACARNSEDDMGQVGARAEDTTMGHRDTIRTGQADTSWTGRA